MIKRTHNAINGTTVWEVKGPRFTTRSIVAVVIIGGFVLAIGTLVWVDIPNHQEDLFDKAIVGLGTLAGAVVNQLFQNKEKRGTST